jgi:hypothetical protein
MTKRDFLKSELLKILSKEFQKKEYKLNKTLCEFTLNKKNGWNKFSLIFLLRDNGWEINPAMLIRENIIEDIFHKTSGFEAKYQKGTPTIGITVGAYLNDDENYRFYLEEEKDVDTIAKLLVDVFYTIVLPFFNKYDTLDKIEIDLNKDPMNTSLTGDIFKGSKSIISSKLLKKDSFNSLKEIYRKYYEKFADGFYLPEYDQLISNLDNIYSSQSNKQE